MKFCSECGAPVERRIPEGDSVLRHVCGVCHTVHYQNPKIVVGCIPEWGNQILLCRRSIEPRRGLWTVPAGFMENGETTHAGALRETREEANARVEIAMLYALHDLPYANQIYLIFRARLLDLNFSPGAETLEVSLFNESEIPWDQIAFRTVHHTLVRYYEDRRRGEYRFHLATIDASARHT